MTQVKAKVKKVNISTLRNQLKSTVQKVSSHEAQELAHRIADRAVELYMELARGWDGGAAFKALEQATAPGPYLQKRADRRKTYPRLDFQKSIPDIKGDRVTIAVTTDNPLFNWLDRGTKGMTVKNGTVMILTINGLATIPGVMGITKPTAGDWVPIQKGDSVAGIPPRGWSKEIADQLMREFGSGDFKVEVELYGRK